MQFYATDKDSVLQYVNATEQGLTSQEALRRQEEQGKNKLREAEKETFLQRFLGQMSDPMILILLAAAAISGVTSFYSGESMADVFIILTVVIINATLGVYQESKAEKAIEALQAMSAAMSKVLRDGQITELKSEDLVVGDIVMLEAGDAVPADGRVLACASLKVEEAALTGESVPVTKQTEALAEAEDIPLGDRKNMVYMGSEVVYGRGKVVITHIGMNTEMGKIADALANAEEGETPLQIKLSQLSRVLSWSVLGICAFIFVFALLKSGDFSGSVILETFMIAVSLAVAAIPEGLVAVVTIVLSIGVTNMSKKNAIIRKLSAVETLGCSQVICSDKTGTLTQNKMTVVDTFGSDIKAIATAMALCNDAEIDAKGDLITGEPTEAALVVFAHVQQLPQAELKATNPRIGEAPFDSNRKMMSTVHQTIDGIVQYTKGAPEVVLSHCTYYYQNGVNLPMNDLLRQQVLDANAALAGRALRVLCCATRLWSESPADYEPTTLEEDLTFIGLTGMIDPVRPEVKSAIERCYEAGIQTVMITGDHHDTAVAIAKELGLVNDASQTITGSQLNEMSDEELTENIETYHVYARVQPEHKTRIVNAWRKNGMITAMTGDGVNDAPSIKNADIGIGMGITGTDVTKNVADMVLADDNFATIVGAVEEGRRIYDNIRKAIQFLLASNLSEVLSIFIATMLGFTILKPAHLLWINLVTDCFPALALGMEKAEPNLMQRKPRSSKDGVFAGGLGFDIIYQGILTTILILASYFIGDYLETGLWQIGNSTDGTTMAFLTMNMVEIFHSLNMRSQRGSIFSLGSQNGYLLMAAGAAFIMSTIVIYVPFLANAFGFAEINLQEFLVAMCLAISIIPAVEIVKFIERKSAK
ncbi:MAG: cation-translocating P-type ATPase [Negativicutes bacterium]|nr:cation-translocating P-type ATPase [Negativicutes bacterium]